jgi:uncharacterized protein
MSATGFQHRYGPWAVVTGASDGIGRAFATECARQGLNVILVARRRSVLETVADQLQLEFGVSTHVLESDLSTVQGRNHLADSTKAFHVGLLVASAGFGTSGSFLNADLEQEANMLQLNCLAVLEAAQTFGKRFRDRGRGGLILLSSLVGWQGTPRAAHYAATKAYVQTLAEGLRIELRACNVDVLAVAPGPVRSGFAERASMQMNATVSPVAVAKASLRALSKRGTVIPGALSKVLTWSLLPLPRSVRARIMGHVMAGMTRNSATTAP